MGSKAGNAHAAGKPKTPRKAWGNFRIGAEYVLKEIARNKRSFSIGWLTVFLTVAFLSFIQNLIDRASVIFIKFSEDSVGQWDLLLTPAAGSARLLLNFTSINTSVSTAPRVTGVAPRWILPAKARKAGYAEAPVYMMAMDSKWESRIDLAAAWPYRELKDGEISVSSGLLAKMKIEPNAGERLTLSISLADVLQSLSQGSPTGTNADNTTSSDGTSSSSNNSPLSGIIPAGGVLISNRTLSALPPAQRNAANAAFTTDANGNINVTSENAWAAVSAALTNYSQEFVVVDAIDSTYGKYPDSLGNVAIMGREAAQTMVDRFVSGTSSGNPDSQAAASLFTAVAAQGLIRQNTSIDIMEYATTIIAVMKDRMAIYSKDDKPRRSEIVRFSNEVATYIGLETSVDFTAVLLTALEATSFMQIFLGQALITVMIVLLALAALLIFSLLLADVEEKTFEYGMLRTLGMRQLSLINLLFFQVTWFSIPGILCGLLFSYLGFIPVAYFLAQFSNSDMDASMSPAAIALGVCSGVVLPILGTIIPTRRALGKTLRDALDVFHISSNETLVRVDKLEKMGLSATEMIIAFILVGVGFLVYYIVPLSFVFNDLKLFFSIMTLILLGMLLGTILLGQVLQHWLEIAIANIVVRPFDAPLVHIVCKNLAAHIRRNSKTASIFTLCLAYVVFASTMFNLQANSLRELVEWQLGADVVLTAPDWDNALPEETLRNYLTNQSLTDRDVAQVVDGYTFMTFGLSTYWAVNYLNMRSLASLNDQKIEVYGLETNFLSSTYLRYFVVGSADVPQAVDCMAGDCATPNVVQGLSSHVDPTPYADVPPSMASLLPPYINVSTNYWVKPPNTDQKAAYETALPILMSQKLQGLLFTDVTSLLQMLLNFSPTGDGQNGVEHKYLCKPIAILNKFPTFPSSLATGTAPVLVSMTAFQSLMTDIRSVQPAATRNDTTIPKRKMLIKFREGTTDRQLLALVNDLTSVLNNDKITVDILRDKVKAATESAKYITYLFYIVAVVGLIFCFFVLWLSFTANIRENSWEFGVLRALGFPVSAVQRVYLYEAFSIIASCVILGTSTGILVALAVALQFNLFTSLPFEFMFPVPLYIVVVVLSFVVSMAGSYLPSRPYAKEKIAVVLKGH